MSSKKKSRFFSVPINLVYIQKTCAGVFVRCRRVRICRVYEYRGACVVLGVTPPPLPETFFDVQCA